MPDKEKALSPLLVTGAFVFVIISMISVALVIERMDITSLLQEIIAAGVVLWLVVVAVELRRSRGRDGAVATLKPAPLFISFAVIFTLAAWFIGWKLIAPEFFAGLDVPLILLWLAGCLLSLFFGLCLVALVRRRAETL